MKYYARNIVGADGANSLVRKTLFPDHKIKTYMSIQQRFKARDGDPSKIQTCRKDDKKIFYHEPVSQKNHYSFRFRFHPYIRS